MNNLSVLPRYTPHEGTVKISGSTTPRSAGKCAYYYLGRGLKVEFFCIGANANQQAMKAMGIFMNLVNNDPKYQDTKVSVAFQPLRFTTDTVIQGSEQHKDKDATVWRTYLVQLV